MTSFRVYLVFFCLPDGLLCFPYVTRLVHGSSEAFTLSSSGRPEMVQGRADALVAARRHRITLDLIHDTNELCENGRSKRSYSRA